jgi:hypothetical protein
MTYENLYGFDSTDNVEFDKQGLPIGLLKLMVTGELPHDKDGKRIGFVAEVEVLEGEHKGRVAKVWFNTLHDDQTTANIAKQSLKRIAEATGKPVTPATPLKGRVFKALVGEQKKNPQYTEIKKYYPADYVDNSAPF